MFAAGTWALKTPIVFHHPGAPQHMQSVKLEFCLCVHGCCCYVCFGSKPLFDCTAAWQHSHPLQACTFTDVAFAGSGIAAVVPSPYYVPRSKYGAMNLAPSSAASFENYAKLQKDRVDAPFFLSGRPVTAKVKTLP